MTRRNLSRLILTTFPLQAPRLTGIDHVTFDVLPGDVLAPAYLLALGAASVACAQNDSAAVPVVLTRGAFNGAVTVTVAGLPAGVTAAPLTIAPDTASGTLTLSAATTAALATTALTVTAAATGTPTLTQPLAVTITPEAVDHVTFVTLPQDVLAPAPPPVHTAPTIQAQAVRFVAPTASADPAVTQISHLFPLPPGCLSAADLAAGYGKLVINGAEQRLDWIEAPTGPYATHDGTSTGDLRGVFVQCRVSGLTQNTPVAAEFRCGEQRAPLTGMGYVNPNSVGWFQSPSAAGPGGENFEDYYNLQGMVLPTSSADACDSGWFWWTRPRTEDPTTGAIATYVSQLNARFDAAWTNANGAIWDGAPLPGSTFYTYYERPYVSWSWGARGDAAGAVDWQKFKRGFAQCFRKWVVTASGVPYGQAVFSSDPVSQFFVAHWLHHQPATDSLQRWATETGPGTFGAYTIQGVAGINGSEVRPMGNAIRMQHFYYLYAAAPTAWYSPHGALTSAMQRQSILKLLNATTADDASFTNAPALPAAPTWGAIDSPYGVYAGPGVRCGGLVDTTSTVVNAELAFQSGIMLEGLLRIYEHADLSAQPAVKTLIRARIKQACDNWMVPNTYLRPGAGSGSTVDGPGVVFGTQHYDGSGGTLNGVSGGGGTASIGAPDLNGFLLDLYYWLAWKYYQDGDLANRDVYVAHGDTLFDGLTRTTGITTITATGNAPKRWAEELQRTQHAIGLRAKAFGA